MDFDEQLRVLKESRLVNARWYRAQYPDVEKIGMDPVVHFLKYGAAMGRKPNQGFDTRFYVENDPDLSKNRLHPLIQYILHGKAEGRRTKPSQEEGRDESDRDVDRLHHKIFGLGFIYRPVTELKKLVMTDTRQSVRCKAALTLSLAHMRAGERSGYEAALEYIEQARENCPGRRLGAELAVMEQYCHFGLDQKDAARAAYNRAGARGEVNPDVYLARSLFCNDNADCKLLHVNFALRRYGLPEVALQGADGSLHGRLTAKEPTPEACGTGARDGRMLVLIGTRDCAQTIGTTLRSLQQQSWSDLEIIVVDRGSSDDTCAVVEGFAVADSRIRLERMADSGLYAACNRALEQAQGAYVTLADAGDWVHPQRLETQLRFLEDTPKAMACTSQFVCASDDLDPVMSAGRARLIVTDDFSLMFRRDPMRSELGFWDTVRFGAARELARRMRALWGAEAVVDLDTGPLTIRRLGDDGAGADVFVDWSGYRDVESGAWRLYREAQETAHENGAGLKYSGHPQTRPFPVPPVMKARAGGASAAGHYDVIIGSDFRLIGGSTNSSVQEIICQKEAGLRTGVVPMYRYDFDNMKRPVLPDVWNVLDGERADILAHGDAVSCDLLILRYPPILQHRQRYLPRIEARDIKVIVNQPPFSDYGPNAVLRYELERCAKNIRHYFGKDAIWYPIGPLVRDALLTHHGDELHHIALADHDWHNIIDLRGWDRGPRRRGPADRLRIGRHARDHAAKWPSTKEDLLAVYPDRNDIEVHVLGGARAPAELIGGVPKNWIVHDYGAMKPREFLAGIDVFVYFAHPDWVESFGRTIIEAMAVGVPVILPWEYRPLFGDAALYATPKTAVDMARKLHADPAAYDAQVATAKVYVQEQFSYEMHVARLNRAGVGQGAEVSV